MYAFWPLKRGVGTTTTATATAMLKAKASQEVLLADMQGDLPL